MKKYILAVFVLLLAGCSSGEGAKNKFTEQQSVPFEIVHYEERIAPIYESLVPHIAYANTQSQFELLQGRFKVDNFSVNMDKYMAVFIVTYSNGCGIAIDGVYDHDGYLAVQLLESDKKTCDKEGVPHTFVLQVEKKKYEKVQLYNGHIIKSSADVE
ncbi:Fe-S oxidoreductase [Solibacillus silvestris]|uniref:Fe-S oxidoreductase n=1 Tax=Solibacillus silvestris TaxID=76853 RepID=UPI003F7E261E